MDYSKVLSDELKEIKVFKGNNNEILKRVIPSAISKLEPIVEDKSTICSILVKTFPKNFGRDLRRYCQAEYKRGYSKPPKVLELFDMMAKVLKGTYETAKEFQNLPDNKKKELGKMLYDEEDYIKLAEQRKLREDISVQSAVIKKRLDKRKKTDELTKFLIRVESFNLTKGEISKQIKRSPKWTKHLIEEGRKQDELVEKLLELDPKCKDILKWFKENIRREKEDREALPLPD